MDGTRDERDPRLPQTRSQHADTHRGLGASEDTAADPQTPSSQSIPSRGQVRSTRRTGRSRVAHPAAVTWISRVVERRPSWRVRVLDVQSVWEAERASPLRAMPPPPSRPSLARPFPTLEEPRGCVGVHGKTAEASFGGGVRVTQTERRGAPTGDKGTGRECHSVPACSATLFFGHEPALSEVFFLRLRIGPPR